MVSIHHPPSTIYHLPSLVDASRTGMADAQDMLIGNAAITNVSGTTAKTGVDYFAVQCLTECTFTTFTENNTTGAITGTAIAAGTIIRNAAGITAVTASSGNLWRAYSRV